MEDPDSGTNKLGEEICPNICQCLAGCAGFQWSTDRMMLVEHWSLESLGSSHLDDHPAEWSNAHLGRGRKKYELAKSCKIWGTRVDLPCGGNQTSNDPPATLSWDVAWLWNHNTNQACIQSRQQPSLSPSKHSFGIVCEQLLGGLKKTTAWVWPKHPKHMGFCSGNQLTELRPTEKSRNHLIGVSGTNQRAPRAPQWQPVSTPSYPIPKNVLANLHPFPADSTCWSPAYTCYQWTCPIELEIRSLELSPSFWHGDYETPINHHMYLPSSAICQVRFFQLQLHMLAAGKSIYSDENP